MEPEVKAMRTLEVQVPNIGIYNPDHFIWEAIISLMKEKKIISAVKLHRYCYNSGIRGAKLACEIHFQEVMGTPYHQY